MIKKNYEKEECNKCITCLSDIGVEPQCVAYDKTEKSSYRANSAGGGGVPYPL